MDSELDPLILSVVAGIGVFTLLLGAAHAYQWVLVQRMLAGPHAVEKKLKKLWKERQRLFYEQELNELDQDRHLAAFGYRLLKQKGRLFQNSLAIARELVSIQQALGSCSTACFTALKIIAESCQNLPLPPNASPYVLADGDPMREKARFQVLAVMTAALQMLDNHDGETILDPNLVIWKINLEAGKNQWCRNCPVVHHPEAYEEGCPVMIMAGTAKKQGANEG